MKRIRNFHFQIFALFLAVMAGCSDRDVGTLVVYAAGPRNLAEWLCGEFEKETKIPTVLYSATTGEIMGKLQAEEFHPRADVVLLASPVAMEALKDLGMLRELPSDLSHGMQWFDDEGFYAGTSAAALGIAVRKDQYDPELEWKDLFDGKYKGRMIMPSPSQSGTSGEFVTAFHLLVGEDFWSGMAAARRAGLQISGPNSQALTGLILQSHDAVLASADYLVMKAIEKGEPLRIHYPASGVPVISRPVAIMSSTPCPEAAETFVRFCFSQRAQERMAAEHLLPADVKIPLSAIRSQAILARPWPMDAAKAKIEQRSALRRFVYEIERGGGRVNR